MIGDAFSNYTFHNMLGDDQEFKSWNMKEIWKSKVSELKGNSDDDEWLNSKASFIKAVKTLGKPSSYDFKNERF